MPLFWIYSVMMSLFILLMLINIYYFKDKEVNMFEYKNYCDSNFILFMW